MSLNILLFKMLFYLLLRLTGLTAAYVPVL